MDCSGMIFSLIEEAASTGAVYSFALNRYWGPGQNPMWDQSWGVLHLMTVGSNGEGNVLLWGPHWYGLPNLTVNDPISLELAEGAIWFGYNLGDPPQPTLTVLAQVQCFGDTSNLLVQGTEQVVDADYGFQFPQEVFLWFKKFLLSAEVLQQLGFAFHALKPKG